MLAMVAALGAICWAIFRGYGWSIWRLVAIYPVALFVLCMVCHGELYRLRPDPKYLTGFYLMIATGGAVGGVFVAIIAPVIFNGFYELHFSALLSAILFLLVCRRDSPTISVSPIGGPSHFAADRRQSEWRWMSCILPLLALGGGDWLLAFTTKEFAFRRGWFVGIRIGFWLIVLALLLCTVRWRKSKKPFTGVRAILVRAFVPWAERKMSLDSRHHHKLACAWLTVAVLALADTLWLQRETFGDKLVYAERNFYGVLQVFDHSQGSPPEHLLWLRHGRIQHGAQFPDPQRAFWPTFYYGEQSGVGLALLSLPSGHRRFGVIGLGTGTLATYAHTGDYVHMYEINPTVQRLAMHPFTFLSNCQGKVEVTLGDARLSLEREPRQDFDLLALDAFNSDAIPVHLFTAEAFEVYNRHLKTNGIIAVHISNNWLDLEPVLANFARRFNYRMAIVDQSPAPEQWWLSRSIWALLTRNTDILDSPTIRNVSRPMRDNLPNVPLWTDDFSSVFQLVN
jgi:SAM-dependent methyltransferase